MPQKIAERGPVEPANFVEDILVPNQPVVLRRQVQSWPAVVAGRQSPKAMAEYIASFDTHTPLNIAICDPSAKGRLFYTPDLRGFNFHNEKAGLSVFLAELLKLAAASNPPALYAASISAERHLPGWAQANPMILPMLNAEQNIWIGNGSRIAPHYDEYNNIACVVSGRRQFTLFPPEQIANLYIGPLELTPAGTPISMVDLDAPDFEHYPRFAEAQNHALVADLEPGDAIFIPSLWWHSVKAQGPLNVLFNYWWNAPKASPALFALAHALLSLRDLPKAERDIWRLWFDHYIFADTAPRVADHLQVQSRGILGPPSPGRTKWIKEYLISALGE
jgi:ribosomal protein L16 Arg81 hydroxylase